MSPLDRLGFIDGRGLGALEFEPADTLDLVPQDLTLLTLARQTREVIAGDDGEALRQLALIGGSPHGARPKVLVYYDTAARTISSEARRGYEPWLVKFPAQNEHKEVCALEELYATQARLAGLEVTETQYFDLDAKLAAFGTRRFDVEAGLRVPTQTLAAALHADFRLPSSVDYTTFLRALRAYSRDEREVKKGFERAVFNVIFNNRDDHSKNLSFRLTREARWTLAPAYDLTYCEGPGGEHQMDVCGEGRDITRANLLELAQHSGVDAKAAARSIERISEVAGHFRHDANTYPIRRATLDRIHKAIEANRARMRSDSTGVLSTPKKPARVSRADLLAKRKTPRGKKDKADPGV
jgi:serine/threonine-protein kinase HipA